MEKQVESLRQELVNVATKISNIYGEATYSEKKGTQKELQRLQEQIEGVFGRYIGVVPQHVISSLTSQTNDLLMKTVESSRVEERNEMVSNRLAKSAKASSAQAMSQGVEEVKAQGVYEDKSFEAKTDEILDRVIKAYRKVLDQAPSKGADLAFDEIRGYARGAFNKVQQAHEDYTQKIKSEVLKQIDELGISLSSVERQQVEAKSATAATKFEEQLAANVEEPTDVASKDAEALSENAFVDSPSIGDGKVQDNSAMFK